MKWAASIIGAVIILLLVAGYWGLIKLPASKKDNNNVPVVIAPVVQLDNASNIDEMVGKTTIEIAIFRAYKSTPVDKAAIRAFYTDAVAAYQNNDFESAVAILPELVANDNTDAKVLLADMYRRGAGVPQDLLKSVALFESAIKDGNVTAAFALGSLYEGGALNGGVDMESAVRYWEIAADGGYLPAQEKLKGR